MQQRSQLTAFFTRAPILASAAAVNSFSAKATGHTVPSSRFALSLKPNVAYLVLNFCALWKKQTTSPSLAYAGIPYQVFGERAGALALMMAWSRSAMARSGSGMSTIFASTSLSPSALCVRGPRRAAAFSSWTRSFIAARSSSVNPRDVFVVFVLGFLSAMVSSDLLCAELLCVVGVQSLPAAEFHGLGADDASNGLTGEKPLQHIEADVPARSAHRYEITVDVVPKREPGAAASQRLQFPADVLSPPVEFEHLGRVGPLPLGLGYSRRRRSRCRRLAGP